jgi:hypothetical protein
MTDSGGHPVFRDASDGIDNARRTGYSAYAEYDGGGWSIVIKRHCNDGFARTQSAYVVPAKAGTHTARTRVFGSVADAFCTNERQG